MKKKLLNLASFLFGTIVFANYASAEQLELRTPSKVQIDYQPFSGLPASTNIKINLTIDNQNNNSNQGKDSNKREQFRLRFTPSQGSFIATNKNGQKLPLNFTSRQNNSQIRRIGNQFIEDVTLNPDQRKRYDFDYTVGLSESQFAKPGTYRLLLDVDITTLATNEIISQEERVEIEVIVDAKLQANIAGTQTLKSGGAKFAIIDFGELKTGKSETVSLQIRGNTDASITLISENNGRMKHKTAHHSFINYTIDFDGTTSDLKSPLSLIRPVAKNLSGSVYPLNVTIGDVRGAYSGRYRDIITVNVDPY